MKSWLWRECELPGVSNVDSFYTGLHSKACTRPSHQGFLWNYLHIQKLGDCKAKMIVSRNWGEKQQIVNKKIGNWTGRENKRKTNSFLAKDLLEE